jgi:hypothetical protein
VPYALFPSLLRCCLPFRIETIINCRRASEMRGERKRRTCESAACALEKKKSRERCSSHRKSLKTCSTKNHILSLFSHIKRRTRGAAEKRQETCPPNELMSHLAILVPRERLKGKQRQRGKNLIIACLSFIARCLHTLRQSFVNRFSNLIEK